jgi:hypothetical protein
VWRNKGSSRKWDENDTNLLYQHYPNTPRSVIVTEIFPQRTWASVVVQASKLHIKRLAPPETLDISENVSAKDSSIMKQLGLTQKITQAIESIWLTPPSLEECETLITPQASGDEGLSDGKTNDWDPLRRPN